jgi:hypothetical protein
MARPRATTKRPITDVIRSAFARGEFELGEEDADALRRSDRRSARFSRSLANKIDPASLAELEIGPVNLDAFYELYRVEVLRQARHFPPEARQRVRERVEFLNILFEINAALEGKLQRFQNEGRRAAARGAATKREHAADLLTVIDDTKAGAPGLSEAEAIRRHLKEQDSQWWRGATTDERAAKVEAVRKQLQRARRRK